MITNRFLSQHIAAPTVSRAYQNSLTMRVLAHRRGLRVRVIVMVAQGLELLA